MAAPSSTSFKIKDHKLDNILWTENSKKVKKGKARKIAVKTAILQGSVLVLKLFFKSIMIKKSVKVVQKVLMWLAKKTCSIQKFCIKGNP